MVVPILQPEKRMKNDKDRETKKYDPQRPLVLLVHLSNNNLYYLIKPGTL